MLHGFYKSLRRQLSISGFPVFFSFIFHSVLLNIMVANTVVTTSGADAYNSLSNNTHEQWTKDAGLRRLNLGVGLMFTSAAANGYDGSLMNGLLALPLCVSLQIYCFQSSR